MLRNPAYRGQAAFGKTKTAERHRGPTRTTVNGVSATAAG